MANSLTTRSHSINKTVFDDIDTPEKAYWLGVLYADGAIDKTERYIRFETKDLDWITQFKLFLQAGHKIYPGKGTWIISIGCQHMAKALIQHNVIPNKTYNHTIPMAIPNGELESHFWRGIMDGDGCIGYYPNQKNIHYRCRIVITSLNKSLLKQCNLYFTEFGIKTYIATKHNKYGDYYHWCYGPRSAFKAKEVLDIIYKNSTVESRLKRKYNKYLEICEEAKGYVGKRN